MLTAIHLVPQKPNYVRYDQHSFHPHHGNLERLVQISLPRDFRFDSHSWTLEEMACIKLETLVMQS